MTEEDWVSKLDVLKDLKAKHELLDDLRISVKDSHAKLEAERKYLADFKTETQMLEQEKINHIEILRQINKDLEDMTSITKRSIDHQKKLENSMDQLFKEYIPVKEDVDRMRMLLDLDRVSDLSEEGIHVPDSLRSRNDYQQQFPGLMVPHNDYGASPFHHPIMAYSNQPHPQSSMMPSSGNICDPGGAVYRQKPPPMKKCPTCANDIHRNAPICPICKSKSHSKNPKKSKKKPAN